MGISLTRHYMIKTFKIGQIADAFKNCLSAVFSIDANSVRFSISSKVLDSGKENRYVKIDVCKFDDTCNSIFALFDDNNNYHKYDRPFNFYREYDI